MDDRLITIARFASYIEAELAKQQLEDFEIKAVVIGGNASNILGLTAVEGPKLQVLKSRAKEALEILESSKEQGQELEFEEEEEQ
jgi:hypothetical protein